MRRRTSARSLIEIGRATEAVGAAREPRRRATTARATGCAVDAGARRVRAGSPSRCVGSNGSARRCARRSASSRPRRCASSRPSCWAGSIPTREVACPAPRQLPDRHRHVRVHRHRGIDRTVAARRSWRCPPRWRPTTRRSARSSTCTAAGCSSTPVTECARSSPRRLLRSPQRWMRRSAVVAGADRRAHRRGRAARRRLLRSDDEPHRAGDGCRSRRTDPGVVVDRRRWPPSSSWWTSASIT